jgi:putative GTP pyrophosphokinase
MISVDKQDFLAEFDLDEAAIDEAGLTWGLLESILHKYMKIKNEYERAGNYIVDTIRQVKSVHSIRMRVKSPTHLLEKIIRKKRENNEREITLDNFTSEIKDLVGVRVLHLFKEDWKDIHEFIVKEWDFAAIDKDGQAKDGKAKVDSPIAYIREGDDKTQSAQFAAAKLEVKEHPEGYRSLHYVIQFRPSKRIINAEIQVRTIFEEGWSEIDHKLRYPKKLENTLLSSYLKLLNRIAGTADEMASFLGSLDSEVNRLQKQAKDLKDELELSQNQHLDAVRKLDINASALQELEKLVRENQEKESKRLLLSNVDLQSAIQPGAIYRLLAESKFLSDYQGLLSMLPDKSGVKGKD